MMMVRGSPRQGVVTSVTGRGTTAVNYAAGSSIDRLQKRHPHDLPNTEQSGEHAERETDEHPSNQDPGADVRRDEVAGRERAHHQSADQHAQAEPGCSTHEADRHRLAEYQPDDPQPA